MFVFTLYDDCVDFPLIGRTQGLRDRVDSSKNNSLMLTIRVGRTDLGNVFAEIVTIGEEEHSRLLRQYHG